MDSNTISKMLNAEDHLKLAGKEAVFEAGLKAGILQGIDGCSAFGPLKNTPVRFITNEPEESQKQVIETSSNKTCSTSPRASPWPSMA
jgi:hypothetical protein